MSEQLDRLPAAGHQCAEPKSDEQAQADQHPEDRTAHIRNLDRCALLGAWAPRPAGEGAAVEGAAAGVAVHVEAVEEVVQ